MYACLFRPPAPSGHDDYRRERRDRGENFLQNSASPAVSALNKVSACGLASEASGPARGGGAPRGLNNVGGACESPGLPVFRAWGIKTLGELAALPSADLAARLGSEGLAWQAIARGDDARPLVPAVPEEPFEASIDLEWPIEGLEPLSFVLTRLLEPLSTRLERCDRGAAVLRVRLRLVSKAVHGRSLQLPSPIRDVRTLRTLALLDLESPPPAAAIGQVAVR